MSNKTDALKTLHTHLIDSVDGYQQAHDNMNGEHKAFIERCLSERRGFHDTLHTQLAQDGIETDESGSTAAAAHRVIFNIRDAISSGDAGIMAECARGDSHLKSAYDDAIDQTKGEPGYDFLTEQRAKVEAAVKEAETLS
ncbi:hypothetical protein PARPLA_01430 [Rhodobacteraceae bacterium THAF1]|uniref:PA2169 family four-helix-bundle protein n=1 Tax=Palleronia sp. THAF1 TaxID=2587842 RepID=UPI000F3DB1EA|nr:PA2169 family four-helix-bundle protein [Palleronia sp. THAF1]QFU09388.1 hypothetical protein FIU81_11950 [Palleronia sp. THAF1]VDC22009.1 hypothetical protein PARPLA_01430 [Rhodobacteraceae bacterium THAF1]